MGDVLAVEAVRPGYLFFAVATPSSPPHPIPAPDPLDMTPQTPFDEAGKDMAVYVQNQSLSRRSRGIGVGSQEIIPNYPQRDRFHGTKP
jgi:hypothetical protein